MRFARIGITAFCAMTTLTLSVPAVFAHNTTKYTNIPFVVAGGCLPLDGCSTQILPINGTAVLHVVNNGISNVGGEIYCSVPSTGTLPAQATGTFPGGTLTFTTSLTSGVTFPATAFYSNAPTTPVSLTGVVSGNTVSITASPTSGNSVVCLAWAAYPTSGTIVVNMSNFRYNNAPVLFDTTVTDYGTTAPDWCF